MPGLSKPFSCHPGEEELGEEEDEEEGFNDEMDLVMVRPSAAAVLVTSEHCAIHDSTLRMPCRQL